MAGNDNNWEWGRESIISVNKSRQTPDEFSQSYKDKMNRLRSIQDDLIEAAESNPKEVWDE